MSWPTKITTFALLAILGGAFSLTNGCNQPSGLDAKTLANYRTALALADEPADIQTVADIRSELVGEAGEEPQENETKTGNQEPAVAAADPIEVAMVGHIGGLANPWKTQRDYPFDTTKAVFFLADPQAVVENESHGHTHAPGEECAFCAAYAAENSHLIAMVQFVDDQGKVLPTDIRQVFDVKEKDTVVVSGSARVTEGGMMVVNATGLYIRN